MKKSLCLISSLLVATTCMLSPPTLATELTDALKDCREQQNALKRLVCYDEITLQSLENSTSMPQASPSQTTNSEGNSAEVPTPSATSNSSTPRADATAVEDNFGLEHKKVIENQADQIYLTVSSIRYSPRKELIVEFENGQIWRQSGSDFYKIAVGEIHYIKRGVFNSFSLGNDDNNRMIKVRRVD